MSCELSEIPTQDLLTELRSRFNNGLYSAAMYSLISANPEVESHIGVFGNDLVNAGILAKLTSKVVDKLALDLKGYR